MKLRLSFPGRLPELDLGFTVKNMLEMTGRRTEDRVKRRKGQRGMEEETVKGIQKETFSPVCGACTVAF